MKKITLLLALFIISLSGKAQVLLANSFDSTVGWTSTTVANDATPPVTVAAWSRKTVGSAPTCSPFAGAGMVRFNSYNIPANGTGRLTSPAITFAGADYRVRFNMYRDAGYPADADNVKVYVNGASNLTGATLLGTINRSLSKTPIEATEGWYEYAFNLPTATTGAKYIIFSGTSAYGNNIFVDEISVEVVPTLDARLVSIDVPSFSTAATNPISGIIKNNGATTITSMDLNWQIGTGTIYTQSLSGLNITNNLTYPFTHQDQWIATPGQYSLKVWVSNVNNGATDSNLVNDEIIKSLYVVNEIFPKTTVYEEGTGSWCGWCVRGHAGLKDMLHNHQDDSFIGIAVHNGDPMVVTAYDAAMATFISGYPSGIMNRVHKDVDAGISAIEDAYAIEITRVPVAKIDIQNQVWNPATREISFDAVSTFALDMSNSNFNISGVIVENGVTGTATGYNQANYYVPGAATAAGIDLIDWEGINWKNLPNPIPAASMVYNHVGRALLGGFDGFAGSVPTTVVYNTPYSYNMTYTLPTTQDENNTELVVFVLDNVTGQIVNARMMPLNTQLSTNQFAKNDINLYPNPSTGIVHFDTPNAVSIAIVDVLGKTVFTAQNVTKETNVDLSNLQKGVYFAKINGESGSFSKKIILK
jgi:hypothetical protein